MKLATLTTAFALALPVAAQYRADAPPVMPPPPRASLPDDRPALEAFQRAYRQAGSPRIVVFWNRTFGEALQEARVKQVTLQSRGKSDSIMKDDTSTGPDGSSRLVEGTGSHSREVTRREGEVVVNEESRIGPNERAMWVIEAEFTRQLDRGGVQLVDRAAIMRATHLADGGRRGNDSRTIETAALEGRADLLMEVLLAQDATAPSGWAYRVTVKSVKTGLLLVNFVTLATPPRADEPPHYVATDKGFQRASRDASFTLNEVAQTLGFETLNALGPKLAVAVPAANARK